MLHSAHSRRATLKVQRLEDRNQTTVNAYLSSNYVVGLDADPTGATHSSLTNFNANGNFSSFAGLANVYTPFDGFTGGLRVVTADFNHDGVPDRAFGTGPTGPGEPAQFVVQDGKTGTPLLVGNPFGQQFTGGIFVAAGNISGNGYADLIVTPDVTGSSRVIIYSGLGIATNQSIILDSFLGIRDDNFRGGARPAAGDINGDGYDDLVISAGFGGGPRISVYDGKSLATGSQVNLIPDFFMFESTLRNGAYVAVGDVDGDNFADIIGGGGPGGGPRVLILSGATLVNLFGGSSIALSSPIANFYAGPSTNRGGIRVSAKLIDGDAVADVLTGTGSGDGSTVNSYLGADLISGNTTPHYSFSAYPGYPYGIYVG